MTVLEKFGKYFESKGLKRMRFKVDPTLKDGFQSAKTYEGYVLTEFHDVATIYIPVGDNMGMHDLDGILPIPDKLDPIKQLITCKLSGKVGQEYIPQIQNAATFDEIEQYLRHCGFKDEDIIALLKQTLKLEMFQPPHPGTAAHNQMAYNPLPKPIRRGAAAIGRGLYKATAPIRRPLKTFKAGAEALTRLKHKSDRATQYLKTFDTNTYPTVAYDYDKFLTPSDLLSDRHFMEWFDHKYGYHGDYKKIHDIINNSSINQLNYYARKYKQFTGRIVHS